MAFNSGEGTLVSALNVHVWIITDVEIVEDACGSEPPLRDHSLESANYFVNLISILFAWEFPGATGSGVFVMIN